MRTTFSKIFSNKAVQASLLTIGSLSFIGAALGLASIITIPALGLFIAPLPLIGTAICFSKLNKIIKSLKSGSNKNTPDQTPPSPLQKSSENNFSNISLKSVFTKEQVSPPSRTKKAPKKETSFKI